MSQSNQTLFSYGDYKFYVTPEQEQSLKKLEKINVGRIGTITNYISTSNRTEPEISDFDFITKFSVQKLYERKLRALNKITLDDLKEYIEKDNKLSVLPEETLQEEFEKRLEFEKNSLERSLNNERDDPYREAHDRVYATLFPGVKVHYLTEKKDGKKVPVLMDGYPICESVQLKILEVDRKVKKKGEYKKVNSGIPVRISNCIKKVLNQKSVGIKTLKLSPEKFESLKIHQSKFLAEDFKDSRIKEILS